MMLADLVADYIAAGPNDLVASTQATTEYRIGTFRLWSDQKEKER